MAQTSSGISEQAKILLSEALASDSKVDKTEMINSIVQQLTPMDSAQVLQMASLNPEIIDEAAIEIIRKNISSLIQVGLEEKTSELMQEVILKQAELEALQAELDEKKEELDLQKNEMDELNQVIEELVK